MFVMILLLYLYSLRGTGVGPQNQWKIRHSSYLRFRIQNLPEKKLLKDKTFSTEKPSMIDNLRRISLVCSTWVEEKASALSMINLIRPNNKRNSRENKSLG